MPPHGGAPGAGPYNAVDAVKYGWTKFSQNVVPFVVLTLAMLGVAVVVNLALSIGIGFALPRGGFSGQIASLVSSLITTVIVWGLGIALARGALDVVDTGRTEVGEMFTRIDWGQALVAGILVSIAVNIGFLLLVLPGLVLAFLLSYTNLAVVDGAQAIDAIKGSYAFVTGHLAETLIYALIGMALSILGVCTLGLGLIVITPVVLIGLAYTWRVLQGRPVAA
ncbi:hypothetical protein [Janibacter sp. GS2]|uniref:hypothetical protein n=1 Tax=Janibacter sp. GS2 TaxID=3442646 RepID=UPI003EB9B8C8